MRRALCANSAVGTTRVSVVSLEDERVIASMFRDIRHSTAMHTDLRCQIFRQVAKSAKLQHMLLDVLSKDHKARKAFLRELAKVAPLKRKFVVIAHEQMSAQNAPTTRKQPGKS